MKSDTDSEIISFLPFSHLHFMYSKNRFTASEAVFLSLINTNTAPLIHALIDHIDVCEAEGKGKNKTQRVVIHYNFVGYLETPESNAPCFTADTRQGVAIGYIAKSKEKSAEQKKSHSERKATIHKNYIKLYTKLYFKQKN